MPDLALIGEETKTTSMTIDPGSVIEFARAVGETNPVYLDPEAARAAGYDHVLAPPTYPIAFMAESMDPELFLKLDLNLPSIVHGEQEFGVSPSGGRGRGAPDEGSHRQHLGEGRPERHPRLRGPRGPCFGPGRQPVYTSKITLISKRAVPEEGLTPPHPTTRRRTMTYQVGDQLEPLVIGEMTKETIAEYSRVSKDPNPMHTDEELAQAMGYPTVYAQGMLGMAYLARHLVERTGLGSIRRIQARFKSMTWPGETITCRATVTAVTEKDGVQLVTCDIHTENGDGEPKVIGSATFAS